MTLKVNPVSIKNKFSPNLFWDVDEVNLKDHAPFIITRVLNEGMTEDIISLRELVSENDIEQAVRTRKNLDRRTAYFWCHYFNIPLEQCKALSNQEELGIPY